METVPFDIVWKRFTGGEPPNDMSGELLPFLEQLFSRSRAGPHVSSGFVAPCTIF